MVALPNAADGDLSPEQKEIEMTHITNLPFSFRSVAQGALVGSLIGATAVTLWQFPAAKEFASSDYFKKALLDGIGKLIDGAAGSSSIAPA